MSAPCDRSRRLLITGASGNLGCPLSALAASGWQTTGTTFHSRRIGGGQPVTIDLRDRDAVLELVHQVQPDVIIHTAASDRSADMVETNRLAARHISEAAHQNGSRLIALSTDMIWDGANPPYGEDDPPAPLSAYGQVKAENEQTIRAALDDCLIVRTSLIYDLDPANRQVSWMLESIAAGRPVTLFVDEIRHPIWVWNLAEALLELAALPVRGVLNVAGPQAVSRWDYGCALLQALGYDPADVARPVYAAQVAPGRPADLTLRLDRAAALLRAPLLSLEEALPRAAALIDRPSPPQ